MEPEEKDGSEVLETTEVAEETTETPEEPESPDERDEKIATLEKEKAELESKNKQLFERAKKAKDAPSKDNDALSTKDVLYIAKTDIPEEDLDEVLTYAKKMGVDVKAAHEHFKPILAERIEERKTAAASHVRGGARGTSKVSGDELLRKAEQTGEVPTDAAGMQSVFEARQAQRAK